MSVRRPRRLFVALAATCLAASLSRVAHAAPPPCPPVWSSVPSYAPKGSVFYGVDAISSTNAWAVGFYVPQGGGNATLAARWDGTRWRVTPTPNLGHADVLEAVTSVAPDDAWAVGLSYGKQTLLEHWDGNAWSAFDTRGFPTLHDVSAVASDDVWAVGAHTVNQNWESLPGILHWDGVSWSLFPTPAMERDSNPELWGLHVVSPNDIWAVGQYIDFPEVKMLVVHWDGLSWSVLPSPSLGVLNDVSAIAPDDVWAVGYRVVMNETETMLLHWDGTGWTNLAPTPPPAMDPYGVSAFSSGDVWVVGIQDTDRGPGGAILHWDGTGWHSVKG